MRDHDHIDETMDECIAADEKAACVALVPVVSSAQWSRPSLQPSQPDSIFLTQLLATAEQSPQTWTLRRADAQTAYQANRYGVQRAGIRTRQII